MRADGWMGGTRSRIVPEPADLELDVCVLYQGQVSKTYIGFIHIRIGSADR